MTELWEILVPHASNDGTVIDIGHHRRWDDHVRGIAGGLTILKTARGIWESPAGEVFQEKMIPVRVACTEEQMRSIIDFTMRHYDQLAVMAYRVSEHVIIQHR